MPLADPAKWDCFVSFTADDEPRARWIVEVLAAAAFRVVWQGADFVAGTDWPAMMRQAAVGARYTIAVLSPRYLESRYGMEEWDLAREAERRDGRRRLRPVLVADPAGGSVRWGEFQKLVWIDLRHLDDGAARVRLLDGLDAARWGGDRPGTPRCNSRPDRLPLFPGREQIFRLLDGALSLRPSMPAIAVLTGVPGVGKSAIAAEYAARRSADFRIVWWVDAGSSTVARHHLADLADALGVGQHPDEPPPADRALRALAGRHGWLLVLDGAEPTALGDVRALLPGRDQGFVTGGRVIVTTRSDRVLPPGLGGQIEVPSFSTEEAVAFLRRRFGWPDTPGTRSDGGDCARLAERLGGLPLALDQAAWRRTASPGEYLHQLDRYGAELLGANYEPEYGRSVTASISAALAGLDPTPAAAAALGVLAALGNAPVPMDLFAATAGDLDPPLDQVASSWIRLQDVVDVLLDRGLARRHTDDLIVHPVVTVHAVVRTIQADIAAATGAHVRHLRAAIRMLDTLASGGPIEDLPAAWDWWRRLLPHVLAVAESPVARIEVLPGDALPAAVTLLDRAATYLRLRGDPDEAVAVSRRALAIAEEHGPDAAAMARALLAPHLLNNARAAEALEAIEPALAVSEGALADHPAVAEDLAIRSEALSALGLDAEALRALERAIEIVERIYGPDAEGLYPYLVNRTVLLVKLHRPAEGLRVLGRAEALAPAAAGAGTPAEALRLGIRGALLRALGRAAEAVATLNRAAELTQEIYGEAHQRTRAARRNAARAAEAPGS